MGLLERLNILHCQDVILKVENLSTSFNLDAGLFSSSKQKIKALDGVSFELYRGETFGIVGESGSGKTTLAKTIASIFKKSGGSFTIYEKESPFRLRYVFPDPASSLNPRMSIYQILTHGYRYSVKKYAKSLPLGERKKLLLSLKKDKLLKRVKTVLNSVGLDSSVLERRSSDFSGGQRQRISLARALMFEPSILICDEVVSALDLSVQAQILNLLVKLKKEYRFSMIFIAHDLAVVSYICDRVAVMNKGKIVEVGEALSIVQNPKEEYTKRLYQAIPQLEV